MKSINYTSRFIVLSHWYCFLFSFLFVFHNWHEFSLRCLEPIQNVWIFGFSIFIKFLVSCRFSGGQTIDFMFYWRRFDILCEFTAIKEIVDFFTHFFISLFLVQGVFTFSLDLTLPAIPRISCISLTSFR